MGRAQRAAARGAAVGTGTELLCLHSLLPVGARAARLTRLAVPACAASKPGMCDGKCGLVDQISSGERAQREQHAGRFMRRSSYQCT